ncbi:MAG: DNA mismatch repair protein MutS [Bryobacteraceae bacterium]
MKRWNEKLARAQRQYSQFGNARLATGIAALAVAGFSIGVAMISPLWLIAPLVVFVILAIVLHRLDRDREAAARGVAYYEKAIGRTEDRWIGKGNQGERFRDSKHVYADDLDLFGRGSLFELLSTARTGAGERTLAEWLLAPGEREEVAARQEAVVELRPLIDLREDIALMGEDIRAAVDARGLARWGVAPEVHFFKGARLIAPVLATAAVVTLGGFFAQRFSAAPFLIVVLAEMILGFAVRPGVGQVKESVAAPAYELRMLALLLERLEQERFTSARLKGLVAQLQIEGTTASRRIKRLTRLIELLDSAENMFFRPVAAMLIWTAQFAMAVEAWRTANGPYIGTWIAAVGEFEALCSLSTYAFERPDATFPQLELTGPLFDADALRHPLIPAAVAVANDVQIGKGTCLWIVSGSNMSGKSTLMRAVGLNAVLAWAGAPVACARLSISALRIGASMSTHDSLADNRSRFYAEISRLRDVVELARSGHPTLFLLDELLSGTNSHDRRIGAEAVVRGLVERGAIGLVSTHDLALAEMVSTLNGKAANVHFEDHIEGGEIRFDYRLRQGVVTRSNALELMRAVGLDV